MLSSIPQAAKHLFACSRHLIPAKSLPRPDLPGQWVPAAGLEGTGSSRSGGYPQRVQNRPAGVKNCHFFAYLSTFLQLPPLFWLPEPALRRFLKVPTARFDSVRSVFYWRVKTC